MGEAGARWIELALTLALGLALLVLAYAAPLAVVANAGTSDTPFLGLHGPERNGAFDYAYSLGSTSLALPLAGSGPFVMALRLAGPAGLAVDVRLDTPVAVELGAVAAPRVYRLLAPPAPGGPQLTLVSTLITPPGEQRALGPLVDWLKLTSIGPARPSLRLAAALVALLALLWAALHQLRVPALPRRATLTIGALALAALLGATRSATDAGPLWLGGAMLAVGLSAILTPPLLQRAARLSASVVVTRRGAIALCAITATAAYALTLRHGYLSDDFPLLFFARHAAPADLWTEFAPPFAASPRPGYYRPLGMLLWWLCYRLAGDSVLLPHLLSVGLHALCAALVCTLSMRLGAGRAAALGAGLLFALFPTHPEAVAWLASRFDLAATAFTLLAALAILRPHRGGPWLAAALVLAALLCKESAIVAPALLLLCLAADLPASTTASARAVALWCLRSLPAVIVTLAYLGWRRLIFGGLGGHLVPGGADPLAAVTPASSALLAGQLASFLTAPLNWPLLLRHAWGAPALVWLAALAGGVALAWAATRRGGLPAPASRYSPLRLAALGLAWAALAAAPLIGTGGWDAATFESGRYAYLPAVGICLAGGALLADLELLARRGTGTARVRGWRPLLYGVIFTLCAAALLQRGLIWGAAAARTERYLSSITLLYPALPAQTTIIARDVPDSYRGAFMLRNGLAEALRLRFDDLTLRVLNPPAPGAPPAPRPPRPDRVSFLAESDGHAIPDPQAATLADALARELSAARAKRLGALPSGGQALARFAGGPELRSFDLLRAPGPLAAEQALLLLLAWAPRAGQRGDLVLHVELVNTDGEVVAQYAGSPTGPDATPGPWAPGELVCGAVPLLLPPTLADGTYRLRLALADPASGVRLAVAAGEDGWAELLALEASSRPQLSIWR